VKDVGAPLTEEELQTLGRTPDGAPVRMHWVGACGTRIEASASIDTLRRAAKRSDRVLFWAWPFLAVVWGGGFCLFFASLALLDEKAGAPLLWIAGAPALFFVGIPIFMAWAAIYTNIDLDVDAPEEQPSEPGSRQSLLLSPTRS
jgi:hypothetical protein